MRLVIIAAVGGNRAIGRENGLLWRIPEDMRRFKETTFGHVVVMGRNTAISIDKPLVGRKNIVLARDLQIVPPYFHVVSSIKDALALCRHENRIFFIGGAQVYAAALPLVSRMYLTEVHDSPPDADAFFPVFDRNEWMETSREPHERSDGLRFDFVEYERKPTTAS